MIVCLARPRSRAAASGAAQGACFQVKRRPPWWGPPFQLTLSAALPVPLVVLVLWLPGAILHTAASINRVTSLWRSIRLQPLAHGQPRVTCRQPSQFPPSRARRAPDLGGAPVRSSPSPCEAAAPSQPDAKSDTPCDRSRAVSANSKIVVVRRRTSRHYKPFQPRPPDLSNAGNPILAVESLRFSSPGNRSFRWELSSAARTGIISPTSRHGEPMWMESTVARPNRIVTTAHGVPQGSLITRSASTVSSSRSGSC